MAWEAELQVAVEWSHSQLLCLAFLVKLWLPVPTNPGALVEVAAPARHQRPSKCNA